MTITWKGGTNNFYLNRIDDTGRQYNLEAIAIHVMDGSLAGMDSWVGDPRNSTSAHYGVEGRKVHQYVKDKDAAKHLGGNANGTWSFLGLPDDRPNFYTLGIEMAGFSGNIGEDTLDEAMWLTAVKCIEHRIKPNAERIIGHFMVNQVSRDNCPFPAAIARAEMDKFIKIVRDRVAQLEPNSNLLGDNIMGKYFFEGREVTVDNLDKAIAEFIKEPRIVRQNDIKGADVQAEFFAIKNRQDAIEQKDTQISSLQSQIEGKNQMIADMQKTVDNQDEQIIELKRQITELGKKNVSLQSELNSFKPLGFLSLFFKSK